jgi:Uma2 family endonuclease
MSTVAQTGITADEVLANSEFDHCEFVGGEIVEKVMSGLAALVEAKIVFQLVSYCNSHGGSAFGSTAAYRCFPDDPIKFRRPDASYISAGRIHHDELEEGYISIAPDLAVEVVSPNDLAYEVETKVDEYLEAGFRLVWLVLPVNQTVRVFRAGHDPIQLNSQAELSGEDVLPGFRCRVIDLFP